MSIFGKLNKHKIESWGDLDPETTHKLMQEISRNDYRIFPFNLEAKDRQGNIIESINWVLPYSLVRETMMGCPSCKRILVKECMSEIERIDILKNLQSDDPVLVEATKDAIKALTDIYNILNPSSGKEEPEKEKDSGKSANESKGGSAKSV